MYSVVTFQDDSSVESVPSSWLEGDSCYWPIKDIKRKIKNQSIPDKEVWSKFDVRVLGKEYDSYETARRYCKKAEDISNLESEDEERKRKRPSKFDEDEPNESEDEDSSQCTPQKSTSERVSLPKPPESSRKMLPIRTSPRKTPQGTSHREIHVMEDDTPRRNKIPNGDENPRRLLQSLNNTISSPITDSMPLERDECLQLILTKMGALEKDMKVIKNALMYDEEDDELYIILPEPLKDEADVKQFEGSMDDIKKKKLISGLASLQGGIDAGKICRKLMRTVMTNGCMSLYSGTGQKGKKPFMETQLFRIVMCAARKSSKKQIPVESLKTEVFDVLRCAPNKPGGANYVKKNHKKRRTLPDMEEENYDD